MKIIFHIIFFTIVTLMSGVGLYAQDFTIESPVKVVSSTTDEEIQVFTTIKNNTAKYLHIRWDRTENTPTGWQSLVCDAQTCWTPNYNTSDFTLEPNSTAKLYVSFFPNSIPGDGRVGLRFKNITNEVDNSQTINFYASATSNASEAKKYKDTKTILEKKQLSIYPNPTSYYFSITPDSRVKKARVFNIVGSLVKEFEVTSFEQKHYIKDLPEGIYLIRFLDEMENTLKTVRLNKL